MNLLDLPTEILVYILKHVPVRQRVISLIHVCHMFADICEYLPWTTQVDLSQTCIDLTLSSISLKTRLKKIEMLDLSWCKLKANSERDVQLYHGQQLKCVYIMG